MQGASGDRTKGRKTKDGPGRIVSVGKYDSGTAQLLYGCPVVTADGERIGVVDHLMVDALTHQLRYVVLARKRKSAVVALPWQALYFDAGYGRLVFYTLVSLDRKNG